MFIFKRQLSRRTFLHGTGAMIALPFLDAMAPAQTPVRSTAASPKNRFACFYVPHGATMDKWTPATEGTGFAIIAPVPCRNVRRDSCLLKMNIASDPPLRTRLRPRI